MPRVIEIVDSDIDVPVFANCIEEFDGAQIKSE
mgnify:CR=1 FL=1